MWSRKAVQWNEVEWCLLEQKRRCWNKASTSWKWAKNVNCGQNAGSVCRKIYSCNFTAARKINLTCDALNDGPKGRTRLSYNWMHPQQSTSSCQPVHDFLGRFSFTTRWVLKNRLKRNFLILRILRIIITTCEIEGLFSGTVEFLQQARLSVVQPFQSNIKRHSDNNSQYSQAATVNSQKWNTEVSSDREAKQGSCSKSLLDILRSFLRRF